MATKITATRIATARTLIIRLTGYLLALCAPGTPAVDTIADRNTWWYMPDGVFSTQVITPSGDTPVKPFSCVQSLHDEFR